jgi:hypothetical protein
MARRTMHARTAVALVATIALAYACGSRTHPFSMVTAAAATGESERPAGLPATTRATLGDAPLATALDVSVHGDDVRFIFHVTNTAGKKLELNFANGQTHDVTVLDAAGGEVWHWGSGQMFTQALRNQRLDARASLTYQVRWRRPNAHGPLTAVGALTSTNYPAESRVAFALP